MYCLLESTQLGSHIPHWMAKDQYQSMRMILMKAQNVRDVVELFSFLEEAIDDLKIWSESTETYGEYLIRNRHAAERRCRGVLLELTTYLDQMEKLLLKKYGKDSDICTFFFTKKNDAKGKCIELAFTLKLRNYSQHCNEIVHSFVAGEKRDYIQPCCIPTKLLEQFDGWNKTEKRFINGANGNIDLLAVFEKVRECLENMQNELVDTLLNRDNLKDELMDLRKWMDESFSREKSSCFHLAWMKYMNGKDAPKVVFYQKKIKFTFDALPVDWMIIYRITDYILKSQEEGA